MEGVNTRMNDSNVPIFLWPYAAEYTTYIFNRIKVVKKDDNYFSPYELFTGNKPDISHIKRWGCLTSIHVPKQRRKKFDAKAYIGYFMGYELKLSIPFRCVRSSS
jgi:hypothetical protein